VLYKSKINQDEMKKISMRLFQQSTILLMVILLVVGMQEVHAQFPCVNANNVTFTMAPQPNANNQYNPGTTVTICVTINGYTQLGANWIHGVFLTGFGAGWNTATLAPVSSPGGSWGWFTNFTATSSGQNFNNPGYFWDSNGGGPGNNFGNPGFTSGTFCFSIQTAAGPSGASLNFGVAVTSDGYTGSWGSSACDGMTPIMGPPGVTLIAGPVIQFTPVNPTCSYTCDGSINTSVSGGVAPYTYAWSGAGSGNATSLNNLCPGAYTLTVTDNAGQSSTQTVNIVAPAPVVITANPAAATVCSGISATLGVSGANTYTWTPATGLSATTGASVTATPTSTTTYTIIGTSAAGCLDTTQVTVTVNPKPDALLQVSTPTCFGQNTTFDATASTVAAPDVITDYAWDFEGDNIINFNSPNPNTTNLYAALGTYNAQLILTTNNGCKDTIIQAVDVVDRPSANFTFPGQICSLTVPFDGSTSTAPAPQVVTTYDWDFNNDGVFEQANAGVNPSNSFPAAGLYTVNLSVTSDIGCKDTVTLQIDVPAVMNVVLDSATDVTCFGANDGTAGVTASGGILPYTFSWDSNPVQNTAVATGLPAGTFTATVTDSTGCITTIQAVIVEPPALTLNFINIRNVSCNGLADGSAEAVVANNQGATNYTWNSNPVQNGTIASNLGPGTYTFTVVDAQQCTITDSITITEPAPLVVTALSKNITCFGSGDGMLLSSSTGGTTPYSYSWNTAPVLTDSTGSNIPAGNYTVTVTDANGCTDTDNVTITEPLQLQAVINKTDVNCPGGTNGSATVTLNQGGVGTLSYSWNSVPQQNTATASNLNAGQYTVTVTDSTGCSTTANTTIVELSVPLVFNGTTSNATCPGRTDGSITLNITQGTGPYTFAWTPAGNTQNLTNIAAGNYAVTITDANGCTYNSNYFVNQNPALVGTISATNVTCFGENDGSIVATANGGTSPYIFNWNNGATSSTISSLTAGVYNVTVTDSRGCDTTMTATINQPTELVITAQNEYEIDLGQSLIVPVNVSGGTSPLFIDWTPSSSLSCTNCTAPEAAPVRTTNYIILVTDASGCTVDAQVLVKVNRAGPFIPNAYTPNNDNKNEEFKVIAYGVTDFMLRIFNRWGEQIFISDDIYKGWNGMYSGGKAESGRYTYRAYLKYLDGKDEYIEGSFTLIR
jgi:gliding motility-associated-like protein